MTGKQTSDKVYFQRRWWSSNKNLLVFQQQIIGVVGPRPEEWSCCCWSLGSAVSNGCDISQQLLLTPLHCCRWGVWLTRCTVSALVRTQWTLTLSTHSLLTHTHTLLPLLPPYWCSHSDSRHTLTFCTTTSTFRGFRPLLTHTELKLNHPKTICCYYVSYIHSRVTSTHISQKQMAQIWWANNRSLTWFMRKTWYVKAVTLQGEAPKLNLKSQKTSLTCERHEHINNLWLHVFTWVNQAY